jgi:hypothetical protein
MRRITALLAASALVLAACGDDDDDDAQASATASAEDNDTATGVQADAADEFIQQMDDDNVDADEDCIHSAFADMSDDDAQKIVDAGSGDAPDLSPEGLAIVTKATADCASGEDMIDSIIEGLPENVDGDCVRDKLKDADFGDIVSSGTLPPELEDAVTECSTG